METRGLPREDLFFGQMVSFPLLDRCRLRVKQVEIQVSVGREK